VCTRSRYCAPPRKAEHESAAYDDERNNKEGYAKTEWIDFATG